MQIRRAAATAREALLDGLHASSRWRRTRLTCADGVVTSRTAATGLSYAQLVGERTAYDQSRSRGAAEGPEGLHDRRHVRAAPRHSRENLRDVQLRAGSSSCPACCMRGWSIQPAFGATLQSFDDTACRKIKGYVRAVRKGNFLAVVATNEWAAISASTAIVATWSDWAGLTRWSRSFRVRAQLEGRPQRGAADDRRHGRRVQARQTNAAGDVRLRDATRTDRSARLARSPISRMAGLTVWTPSQASHLLQVQLATMLSLKPENVRCIFVEGAGCYGRNGADDCSSEAAVDRQGNRPAGATAVDAAGRARLGSEGSSGPARLSRQHR